MPANCQSLLFILFCVKFQHEPSYGMEQDTNSKGIDAGRLVNIFILFAQYISVHCRWGPANALRSLCWYQMK